MKATSFQSSIILRTQKNDCINDVVKRIYCATDNIYTERLFQTIKRYLFDVVVCLTSIICLIFEENLVIYCQLQNNVFSEEDTSEQKITFNLKPLTKVKLIQVD